jgi:excinuclease ABC subunit C
MGIQEEVHRFAITATRRKHEKSNISSELENITGIGPQLRKKLLLHFGGIKKIKLATKEELSKVVNEKLAERIFEYFKSKG